MLASLPLAHLFVLPIIKGESTVSPTSPRLSNWFLISESKYLQQAEYH
jgi:hypothetical protein